MTTKPLRIAVLGARRSGKTWLAEALRRALGPEAVVADGAPWLAQLAQAPSIQTSIQAEPAAHAQTHALTLLTGLDLPPGEPAAAAAREREDAALRAALTRANIVYQVIYGLGTQRLDNALLALKRLGSSGRDAAQFGLQGGRMPWQCGNCSDPDCEHRLFTGLLAARSRDQ